MVAARIADAKDGSAKDGADGLLCADGDSQTRTLSATAAAVGSLPSEPQHQGDKNEVGWLEVHVSFLVCRNNFRIIKY